jgi:hypothetical protein
MDWFFTPPDHAWPKNMHGTQASLSGLRRRTALSVVVIEDREEKPSLTLIEVVRFCRTREHSESLDAESLDGESAFKVLKDSRDNQRGGAQHGHA